MSARRWPGVAAVVLALVSATAAAMTPAGTLITSQARAIIGGEIVVPSNQVATLVQGVCSAVVLPRSDEQQPSQSFVVAQAAVITIPFRVTNRGNVRASFDLDWVVTASDWLPDEVRFHVDRERSARLDAGDPVVETVTLDQGENAALLMVVSAPVGATGELIIGARARCQQGALVPSASGSQLASDVSLTALRLRSPNEPIVNSSVRTAAAAAKPGDTGARLQVSVTTSNSGGDAGEVEIEIPLDGDAAVCLALDTSDLDDRLEVLSAGRWIDALDLPDAARGDVVVPLGAARALRLRLATLAGGEVAELLLQFIVDDDCGSDTIPVSVTTRAGADVTTVSSFAEPRPSAASSLTRTDTRAVTAVVGQPACFALRAANIGQRDDTYTIDLASEAPSDQRDSIRLSARDAAGFALPDTLTLARGSDRAFEVCAVATRPMPAFDVTVRLRSAAGAPAASVRLAVGAVVASEALEVVILTSRESGAVGALRADSGDAADALTVSAGEVVTFGLSVSNGLPFTLPASRVRIDVALAVDADDATIPFPFQWLGGAAGVSFDADAGVVRWDVGTLGPGFGADTTLRLRMRDDLPDDARIQLTASLRTPALTEPRFSAPFELRLWSSALLPRLTITPTNPAPGDLIDVNLAISNPSERPISVSVEHAHPNESDPIGDQGAELQLAPNATEHVSFQARLTPTGALERHGRVIIDARSDAGAALERIELPYHLELDPGTLARDRARLIGRVHDSDDPATGIGGVRVVLADGRSAVTDADGRYAFHDLESGWWRVLIDPDTLPGHLAATPSLVAANAHRILAQGLTHLDVPVDTLRVSSDVARSTTLRSGPITLTQTQRPLTETLVVRVVEVSASESVTGLVLHWRDVSSQRQHDIGALDGSWRRAFVLPAATPFVDPELSWRFE